MGKGESRVAHASKRSSPRHGRRREVAGLALLIALISLLLILLVFTWTASDTPLPVAAARTPTPAVPLPTSGSHVVVSPNWAGMVLDAAAVTGVQARWAVPRVSSNSPSRVAVWVGVGGIGDSSSSLVQIGTVSQRDESGSLTAAAWWETLPSPGGWHHLDIRLSPGDAVSASLRQLTAATWLLRCTDLGTGAAVSVTVAYHSTGRYADWIVEDPEELLGTYSAGYSDLAAFGTVQVRGAAAVVGGRSAGPMSPGALQIVMGRDGATYAEPTAPDSAGSFSVRRIPD